MAWQAPRDADSAMHAQQRKHLETDSATPLMRWMIEGVIHHICSAMTSWIVRGSRDRVGQISRKSVGPASTHCDSNHELVICSTAAIR